MSLLFSLLQNSASPSSRGRLLYIHPVSWSVGRHVSLPLILPPKDRQKPNLSYIWGHIDKDKDKDKVKDKDKTKRQRQSQMNDQGPQ